MKIIDVCDSFAGAGALKQYYEKNNIEVSFYEYLINGLIDLNKIKLVEKNDTYYHSIIEKK